MTLNRKLRWQVLRDCRSTAEQETPPLEKGSCIERESILSAWGLVWSKSHRGISSGLGVMLYSLMIHLLYH